MAGRINDEDIAEVRDRARIDDVVGSHVSLRSAGGGALKGLCPFHAEKTPSFQVTPARGFYYCFGCGEGGDVITFVQKVSNLTFAEAVEHLADRYGVQLRYEESGFGTRAPAGTRLRILEANTAAAEFFAGQLLTPEAVIARQFLDSRGFGREAAEKFGVGYAPQSGRALGTHLKSKGFSEEELIGAGLMRQGGWDFFQGRALWPIRDAGAAVLGFGARRLRDDDRMPAKYLNTPETAVYKKSQVLYGLDLARQSIGKKAQAVVVEGYTDVMAAHLSGVDTAVASCGTAFGDDHARLIQRLLGGDAFHGEVIFTFDGDSAGQKAALKVFGGDQHFAAQTYVAVERSGLDPCDLRLERGEAAVRELVATRQPLYRFVMTNVISQFDLDRVDGRLGALRAAAPLIGSIRDTSLVAGYVRELAQLVGMDLDEVRQVVSRVANRRIPGGPKGRPAPPVDPGRPYDDEPPPDPQDDGYEETLVAFQLPSPDDRSLVVERDTLKLMLQRPTVFDKAPEPWFAVTAADFTHPAYAAVFTALSGVDRAGAEERRFAQAVVDALTDESLRHLAVQLSVEPLPVRIDVGYARTYCAKLSLLSLLRTIADLKSRLQRTNPVENEQAYNQMFGRMVALEVQRKELLRLSSGD